MCEGGCGENLESGMNDQIENYASTDSASDRPLVTFALFAYNQEKYIREAVDSAFAQSYGAARNNPLG